MRSKTFSAGATDDRTALCRHLSTPEARSADSSSYRKLLCAPLSTIARNIDERPEASDAAVLGYN